MAEAPRRLGNSSTRQAYLPPDGQLETALREEDPEDDEREIGGNAPDYHNSEDLQGSAVSALESHSRHQQWFLPRRWWIERCWASWRVGETMCQPHLLWLLTGVALLLLLLPLPTKSTVIHDPCVQTEHWRLLQVSMLAPVSGVDSPWNFTSGSASTYSRHALRDFACDNGDWVDQYLSCRTADTRLKSDDSDTAIAGLQKAMLAMQSELRGLKGGKLVARVQALEEQHVIDSERIQRLEDHLEGYKNYATRSRKQTATSGEQCGSNALVGRANAAMEVCCPNGGGHRRMQSQCTLPDACPSVACADIFSSFLGDCRQQMMLQGITVSDFDHFNSQCQELTAQAAIMGLEPVSVQMFKEQINTDASNVSSPSSAPSSAMHDLDEYRTVCST